MVQLVSLVEEVLAVVEVLQVSLANEVYLVIKDQKVI
jgi:hypothetical protein